MAICKQFNKKRPKILLLAIFLFSIFLISGCALEPQPIPTKKVPDATIALQKKLNDYIVKKPVYYGEPFVLAIPNSKLFSGSSANLTGSGQKILKTIASLLNCYEKVEVKIIGYIYTKDRAVNALCLAKNQAKQVAHYLWQQNIDARLVVASGVAHETQKPTKQEEESPKLVSSCPAFFTISSQKAPMALPNQDHVEIIFPVLARKYQ